MVLGFPPSAPGLTPGWRASLLRMFAAVCALWAMVGVAQAAEPDLAAPVKAGYLYKLTAFVDWPETAFEAPASPFRLCIAGRDPFGGVVDHAAHGAKVGDHRVVVVRVPSVAKGAAACHMLFLAASTAQTPQQMLALVAGQPVLTVADEALEAPGAMVQFVTVEGRVRFEIRADAAQAAGLSVSSKLLSLSAQPKEGGR
jgi:hypothetical protein